jgi:hypothetical protein
MERHQIIEMMRELKLAGMRAAFDEILANGLKRQHSIPQIIGDLLQAEIAEKQARSIKYQVAIARLPLAKELSDFDFSDTPINENLVRDLATGAFLQNQRNAVLIGGTGTGKSILRSPSPAPASAPAPVAASIPRSTWSIGWRPKPALGGRAVSPIGSPGSTSSFSTSSAICRSRNPAASSSSTGQPSLRADFDHRHHQPDFRRVTVPAKRAVGGARRRLRAGLFASPLLPKGRS